MLLLVGCGVDPRPPVPEPTLPDGVWRPITDDNIISVLVARDGDDLVLAYERLLDGGGRGSYLIRANVADERAGEPLSLEDDEHPSASVTAIAVAGDTTALAVQHAGNPDVAIQLHDDRGAKVSGPHTLAGLGYGQPYSTRLVPAPDGTLRYVAHANSVEDEIITVFLDHDGAPTSTRAGMGVPDDAVGHSIAAAITPDGTTLVAWDRQYDICYSPKLSSTFTASVTTTAEPTPTRSVRDLGGVAERFPDLAAAGDTAYVTWSTDLTSRHVFELARFSDPTVVAAELGEGTPFAGTPRIALAAPGQGAVAWSDDTGIIVAPFTDDGTRVSVVEHHVFASVEAFASLVALTAVDDGRYVLVWAEDAPATPETERTVYARTIDLGAPPPAPPPARPRRALAAAPPPCSH